MEPKDSIDTDTGRFCGDCYCEITRDITDEERERAGGVPWESRFRTSSLWAFGVWQAVMAILLIANPGADSLAFFGAVLSMFAAYALGVLMEVYNDRRRVILTLAVFLEAAGAFLWVAGWLLMATTRSVPQFLVGMIVSLAAILSALATIHNLVRAYEGARK